MNRLRLPLFWVVSMLMLTTCDFRSLKDPIVLTDVEDEFILDMWEEITPQGRSFQLRMETIADQPCSNSTIDFSINRTSTIFDISLQQIDEPEDCAPGQAPAFAQINLGGLPPGFYPLSIDLRDAIVNKATLRVRTDAYRLEMDTEYGIKPLRSELRRITPDQFWGYISYPGYLQSAVDSLRQELEHYGTYQLPQDGYYGYFTIANRTLAIKDQPQHQPFLTWIMPIDDADKRELQNIIDRFRETHKEEGLRIGFFDGKGGAY